MYDINLTVGKDRSFAPSSEVRLVKLSVLLLFGYPRMFHLIRAQALRGSYLH